MRKIMLYILFLFACFKENKAQTTIVPDTLFRNFLQLNYSGVINKNKLLIDSIAAKTTGFMDCSGRGISSLSGLEKFTSLSGLKCTTNKLTSLDQIKNLSRLTFLDCYNNEIVQLPDLSKLVNLTYL